jgi:hypothetical protein
MTRRRLLWIGAASVVVLVAWAIWRNSAHVYHAYVRELRAAGEPVDYDGLVGPPVASDDDGGRDVEAAEQWLKDNVAWEQREGVVGPWNSKCDETWPESITPEQLADLSKFLAEIAPCRDAHRRAAAKRCVTFRAGPRDEFGFPSSGPIRPVQEACRVLCTAAVGLPEESARVDAIATLLTLASRVECATYIDDAVAAGCARSADAEVRRALEHGRLDPAAARARLDALLLENWLGRAPAAMRGDRVFAIQAYQTVLDGKWSLTVRPSWRRSSRTRRPGSPRRRDPSSPGWTGRMRGRPWRIATR